MYIPTMGRVMILKTIQAVVKAGHKFLYCDTDSIMFAVKKGVEPFKGMEIDPTKLGC